MCAPFPDYVRVTEKESERPAIYWWSQLQRPLTLWPQVMTAPECFTAAKAPSVAYMEDGMAITRNLGGKMYTCTSAAAALYSVFVLEG
eukprot:2097690-Amphidinium_carterae.1